MVTHGQKQESRFASQVRRILYYCRSNPRKLIKIHELAEQEKCEKRRLYDLFCVLCSLGLCQKTVDKLYSWKGDENMLNTIQAEYEKIEHLSFRTELADIFQLGESPPIGQLALNMVTIFLYFGEKELSLKQVCFVMCKNKSRMEPLLRRLYLAAFFLEQVNVLTHSYQIGSYQVSLDIDWFSKTTFQHLAENISFPPSTVYSYLSRIHLSVISQLKESRYQEMINQIENSHHQPHNNNGIKAREQPLNLVHLPVC